jgi:hypothetical protein
MTRAGIPSGYGNGDRLTGSISMLSSASAFRVILGYRTNPHVANRIWSDVAKPSHAALIQANAALFPFAAIKPDLPPFLECKQERDAALFGLRLLFDICVFRRLFCTQLIRAPFRYGVASICVLCIPFAAFRLLGFTVFRINGAILCVESFSVCGLPRAIIRPLLLSAIVGVSHWYLSARTVVRGAIGADTSMASRLYHTPLRSAC